MPYTPQDLKTALQIDLDAKQMTQDDLGRALGVSQQSVSKWLAHGRIPESRAEQLRQLLGAESHTLQFLATQYQHKAMMMGARSEPGILQQEMPTYIVTVQQALDEARRLAPEALRPYFARPASPHDQPAPDYESPAVVLCAATPQTSHAALVTLMVCKGTKRPVLALWGMDSSIIKLAQQCGALGVSLMPCATPQDIVAAIRSAEPTAE